MNGEDGDQGTEVKTVDKMSKGRPRLSRSEYTKCVCPTSSRPNRGAERRKRVTDGRGLDEPFTFQTVRIIFFTRLGIGKNIDVGRRSVSPSILLDGTERKR